jgi:hypothetical protein
MREVVAKRIIEMAQLVKAPFSWKEDGVVWHARRAADAEIGASRSRGDTEPLEPVCYVLDSGCTPEIFSSMVRSRTGAAKQKAPDDP